LFTYYIDTKVKVLLYFYIVLFLVEKSLANINCLFACMSAEGQKNIRVDRGVIEVEELEYEVSFFKFFYGTIFLDKGPLFYKKYFFSIRVDRRVIEVEEFKYEVSFSKFFYGTIFLDKGPLFYKKYFFL
jgi:hypothetical protein